jgi:hypothetical protein
MAKRLGILAAAVMAVGGAVVFTGSGAQAAESLSPDAPGFAYDAGPCTAPGVCNTHPFTVSVPAGWADGLRAAGLVGVLRVTASWDDAGDDFDVALLGSGGRAVAAGSSRLGAFERITYTEPAAGAYDVQVSVVRAANAAVHVDVALVAMPAVDSASSVAPAGGLAFSNGTPVALERSTGEPNVEIAPNGDLYVDTPGAGNSVLYKSMDNGDTFAPLGLDHPNNNPLDNNVSGGGASATAIDPEGRVCFSDLDALTIAVGCSADEGKTFGPADPLVFDPAAPIVGRQWAAATPQKEQLLAAAVRGGGVRLFKETVTPGRNVYQPVQSIDAGQAMAAFNMAVDPSDGDAGGGTVAGAYVRRGAAAAKPYQLMVWQTTDGGQTVAVYPVADLATNPASAYASIAVDTAGNTYVAWTEQGTWDVLYAVARKGDLGRWSAPVRVNADPGARTAVQPTIKVGDPGRVFIGYYGAPQVGSPDGLSDAVWHGFVAASVNGACQLAASPCGRPAFQQARVTEHPVQYGGICLTAAACSADSYDGDQSLRGSLDLAIAPFTGQVHVVLTDSARSNRGTTVTAYRQVSGPSASAAAGTVSGASRWGRSASDEQGDAVAIVRYASFPAVAADIRNVALTQPNADTLRATMTMTDVTLFSQALQQGGRQLLIATRFATDFDVFWVGFRFTTGGTREFVAGRVAGPALGAGLVDAYEVDPGVVVAGSIDLGAKTITMDVPVAQLKTTLHEPASVAVPTVVPGVAPGQALYGVMGVSFVGTSSAHDQVAKKWLDVAPAFSVGGAPMAAPTSAAGANDDLTARGSFDDDAAAVLARGPLPATGGSGLAGPGSVGLVLASVLAAAGLAGRRIRREGGVG